MSNLEPGKARSRRPDLIQSEAERMNIVLDPDALRELSREKPELTMRDVVNQQLYGPSYKEVPINRRCKQYLPPPTTPVPEDEPIPANQPVSEVAPIPEQPALEPNPLILRTFPQLSGIDMECSVGKFLKINFKRRNRKRKQAAVEQPSEQLKKSEQRDVPKGDFLYFMTSQDQPKNPKIEKKQESGASSSQPVVTPKPLPKEQLATVVPQKQPIEIPTGSQGTSTLPSQPQTSSLPGPPLGTTSIQQLLESQPSAFSPTPFPQAGIPQFQNIPGLTQLLLAAGVPLSAIPAHFREPKSGVPTENQPFVPDRFTVGLHHLTLRAPDELMIPGLLRDPATRQQTVGVNPPTRDSDTSPNPVGFALKNLETLVNRMYPKPLKFPIFKPYCPPVNKPPPPKLPGQECPTLRYLEEQRVEFDKEQKNFKLAIQQNLMVVMRLKNFPSIQHSGVADVLQRAFQSFYKEILSEVELPADVQESIKEQREDFARKFWEKQSNSDEVELDRWLMQQVKYETKPEGKVPTPLELVAAIETSFRESVCGLTDSQYSMIFATFLNDFITPIKTAADAAAITSSTGIPLELIQFIHREVLSTLRKNIQKANYYLVF